jgi:hypothetical protein
MPRGRRDWRWDHGVNAERGLVLPRRRSDDWSGVAGGAARCGLRRVAARRYPRASRRGRRLAPGVPCAGSSLSTIAGAPQPCGISLGDVWGAASAARRVTSCPAGRPAGRPAGCVARRGTSSAARPATGCAAHRVTSSAARRATGRAAGCVADRVTSSAAGPATGRAAHRGTPGADRPAARCRDSYPARRAARPATRRATGRGTSSAAGRAPRRQLRGPC